MFRYQPNRDYFFIPKHTGQTLGVHGNSTGNGAVLEKQHINPESPAQRIRFEHIAFNEYCLIFRISHKCLSVPNDTHDLHANIVQWDTEKYPRQRWRLVNHGDGAYHIISTLNGLALEMQGGFAPLQQNKLEVGAAHQLFQIVAVPEQNLPVNTTSFQTYTNVGRMIVMAGAAFIPKVGGGISGLIGLLWPSDHDQRFWQQMKDYVDVRVTEMLQHQRLINLEGKIAGLRKNLLRANDSERKAEDRWSELVSLMSSATAMEQEFLSTDYRDSHRIMSHLAAWGTLVLVANAQMYRNYDALHPRMTEAERTEGKKPYKKDLLANIKTYTDAVAACRAQALKWRLDKIIINAAEGLRRSNVTDRQDGWVKRYRSKPYHQALIDTYNARREQVTAQFEAEMDALLSQTRVWRFLNPDVTERPASDTVRRIVGPYPRLSGTPLTEPVTGTIKSISLWTAGNILKGIVISYTDKRLRVTGEKVGNEKSLELKPDEYISAAYGVEYDSFIRTLNFETNYGHVLSTGPQEGPGVRVEFWAALDDNLEAKLTGVSGDQLGALYFHWEYSWNYDWTGQTPLAASTVAELMQSNALDESMLTEMAETTEADVVQDFTTREFAPGTW